MANEGGFASMVTAAQIAGSIDKLRFDTRITGFEFKPSLGIVASRLDKFGVDIRSFKEPLTRAIRDVMVESFRQNFVQGGRPEWEALATNTVKKRGSSGPVLVRKGNLARTMATIKIWSIGQTTATIRDLPEKVWYGKVHQAGQEGNEFSGGQWFKKYQNAARKSLGSEADDKEVDKLALKIFDKRVMNHGPAPTGRPAIPARPFAVFQDEDIDAIELIFVEWLEERLRRVGLYE